MTRPLVFITWALLSLANQHRVATETCLAAGLPGIPGSPGLPGRDGRDGIKGEKGAPGTLAQDFLGPQKGVKGDPGTKGYPGKRGPTGNRGESGPAGLDGLPGEAGDTGVGGVQQRAAFSVARLSNDLPERNSVIRFNEVITNLEEDFNTETGRFRCRVPGTYYLVFHASLDDRLCILMKVDGTLLTSFCDHRRVRRQVTSGGLAVHLSRGQEVWLETKDYRGLKGTTEGYSIFSGFLLQAY